MAIDKRVEACLVTFLVVVVGLLVAAAHGLFTLIKMFAQNPVGPATFLVTGLGIIIMQNTIRWLLERRVKAQYHLKREKLLQYARQVFKEKYEDKQRTELPPLTRQEIREIRRYKREWKRRHDRFMGMCERLDALRMRGIERHRAFQETMRRNAPLSPTAEELETNCEEQRKIKKEFHDMREKMKELKKWRKRQEDTQRRQREEERAKAMQIDRWYPSLVVPTPPLPYTTTIWGDRPIPVNLFEARDVAMAANFAYTHEGNLGNMIAVEEADCVFLWCLHDVLQGRYVHSNKNKYQLTKLLRHYKFPCDEDSSLQGFGYLSATDSSSSHSKDKQSMQGTEMEREI